MDCSTNCRTLEFVRRLSSGRQLRRCEACHATYLSDATHTRREEHSTKEGQTWNTTRQ